MRAPILGLAIATVAFGGSSIYLWQQLEQERARAEEVEKRSAELGARLAELEHARAQFTERRMATSGSFITGQISSDGPASVALPPPPGDAAQSAKAEEQPVWTMRRPQHSAAFQKMMRAQARASNKRLYSEVGTRLGLDKETTAKLIDLLTEQQIPNFDAARDIDDPAGWQRYQEEKQREGQAQIADLIGPDKAEALQEYQQSLPARMEVDGLARQLEGYDAGLSADQRKRLIDVYVEERQRVPMPEGYEGMDPEAYQKSINSWQDDYNRRIAEEAAHILTSDQLSAFNEMQQWQKEMRENMANMPPPPGASPRFRRGMAGGNVMLFTTGAPVPIGASASVEVAAPGPAAAPEQKKP